MGRAKHTHHITHAHTLVIMPTKVIPRKIPNQMPAKTQTHTMSQQ